MGVSETNRVEGGVGFHAPWTIMYRINLHSRLASRILWKVGYASYRTEHDIYRAAYGLSWPDWFTPAQTIKVKVSAHRCPLSSLDFVTLRIKDAVCDKFVAVRGRRPTVNTHMPDIRLDAFLDEESITLYLDTSGEGLFKRGHRAMSVDAPIRENLAAGLLQLAGWTPQDTLLDPMCGSGTIPLEAALFARHIAPGLSRRFAFERLIVHDHAQWNQVRYAARAAQHSRIPSVVYASDHDGAAISVAQRTFRNAGVETDIRLRQSELLDLDAPDKQGILVINPPYGVRLRSRDQLEDFYPKMGDWLKQRFMGWRAYILTADLRLPKLIGLAPSKRTPLFNGSLECRFYEFKIVEGPMRKQARLARATAKTM
ncbi:Ribosomal RNA large subunit methyltransferase L [Nitrospira sp. KM1]|uniref:THUMP domain-containing class I SAM-dependent RNA methyltransferase n=1 Tax=Nitrospira sp. KM1 TaxID=1936990 RepID=UPI0013A788EA|nr:THUMP domain-containing protein [Nitrospira sp. KM1]BCA53391.1 Ribosomal RNA large subunit methyltransferase L [Nitrospira sp. KM1]